MMKYFMAMFLSLIVASVAQASPIQVGDQVGFRTSTGQLNNWIWTVDIVRDDLQGASLVAAGLRGSQVRVFVKAAAIYPIIDSLEGKSKGECFRLRNNRLVWQALGFAEVDGGVAYVFSPGVRVSQQRKVAALADLTDQVPCSF